MRGPGVSLHAPGELLCRAGADAGLQLRLLLLDLLADCAVLGRFLGAERTIASGAFHDYYVGGSSSMSQMVVM